MANKMERFTQRARRVLSLAQEEAQRLQHNTISTEHMLLGLMREEGGIGGRVLRDLGLERQRIEELVQQMTRVSKITSEQHLDLSHSVKKLLELAVDEARRLENNWIGTEHLLLGLVRQSDDVAVEIIKRLGISPEEVRRQTVRVLQESPLKSASSQPEGATLLEETLTTPLQLTITIEGNSPIEFSITVHQLREMLRDVATGLVVTKATGTLYEQTIGSTQIKITRGDDAPTDESPKTDA
jgi:ATP-dependent Clp protease ATP-binding subunit ClpA